MPQRFGQALNSTEKIPVEITQSVAGQYVDPTSFNGYLSFKISRYENEPGDDFTNPEWIAAAWENARGHYYLTVLVGPNGAVQLARGRWYVYAGIDGLTEQPIKRADDPWTVW